MNSQKAWTLPEVWGIKVHSQGMTFDSGATVQNLKRMTQVLASHTYSYSQTNTQANAPYMARATLFWWPKTMWVKLSEHVSLVTLCLHKCSWSSRAQLKVHALQLYINKIVYTKCNHMMEQLEVQYRDHPPTQSLADFQQLVDAHSELELSPVSCKPQSTALPTRKHKRGNLQSG